MTFTTKAALTAAATGVLILIGTAPPAGAQTAPHAHAGDHRLYAPQEIKWGPASAAIPKGAETALLYGDPSKEGPFAMRVRFPGDYRVPPHRHSTAEVLTVLSGTFVIGMGEAADEGEARPMPAGSFIAMPPGMPHHVRTEGETVIQINSTGPWTVTYVNPSNDPRRQPQ